MKIELIRQKEWDKTWFKVITDDPYSCKFFFKEEEAEAYYENVIQQKLEPPVFTTLKSIEI